MHTFAPGWYPDPHDPGRLRYWDGAGWTQHTHPIPQVGQGVDPRGLASAQSAPAGAALAPRRPRAWLWWAVGVAAILLVAATAACVWWALAVLGQASEGPASCGSSPEQCDGAGRERSDAETAPTPTPRELEREREQESGRESTAELRRFCEDGAVEAYLDLQAATIDVLRGSGTTDEVGARLDLFEQELAQVPEEVSSSPGYAAAEVELRQFVTDVRASVDAADPSGLADLILDGPDVVGAFDPACSGFGFIGW